MPDDGGIAEYVAANRLDMLVEISNGVQAGLGARFWDQVVRDYPDVPGPEKTAGYAEAIARVSAVLLNALTRYAPIACPECGGALGCIQSGQQRVAELIGVIDRNQVFLDEKDEALVDGCRRWLV